MLQHGSRRFRGRCSFNRNRGGAGGENLDEDGNHVAVPHTPRVE